MELGLKGLKAIVTGGTRGIGLAIVERLAGEGTEIAFCARDADMVEARVAALNAGGAKAHGSAVDVADGESLMTWVDEAARSMGGLDILIANVSAMGGTLGDEGWRRGFDIDIMGTVHAVDAAFPHLEKSAAASIVVIATTAALEAFGGGAPLRCRQSRTHQLRLQSCHHACGSRYPRQHRFTGHDLFRGWRVGSTQARSARHFRMGPWQQPDGTHGKTRGSGQRRRIPGKPRRQLHHRRQSGRRRRSNETRPVLARKSHQADPEFGER